MSAAQAWILAARPKTLAAGASPVLIGAGLAALYQPLSFPLLLICLLFSLAIQIGANWANDYFDYIKGADTAERKGPARAVQSGWITPRAMRNGSFGALAAAALFALPLLLRIGLAYLPLMLLCIACALLYTGGKKPLGYLGLGELFVFLFYGPVATACTALVQLNRIPSSAWIASLLPGFLSAAILVVNNLRDADPDAKVGKLTLAARFGKRFGQIEYLALIGASALVPLLLVFSGWPPSLLFIYLLLPLWKKPIEIVLFQPEQLNTALALTARLLALHALFIFLYATLSL